MDPLKEQLSAFLDGELPEAETELFLKRLGRDDGLASTLSRYSLIGAAMRAEGGTVPARPVAARVSAAIAREPSLTRPARNWRRPLAGVGIAAGVALAAVLLAGGVSLPGTSHSPAAATLAALPAGAPPAAGTASFAAPAAVQVAAVVPPADEPLPKGYTTPPAPEGNIPPMELANFLVAHSEHASFVGRRAVVTSLLTDAPASPPGPAR